jgi:predicted  nucleic acid-binding Zn-ribbon protein
MTKQLHSLLLLQEIDALLDDLGLAARREAEEALGFSVGPTKKLRAKRNRIARELRPDVINRYEDVRRRHPRAVAPVRRGACLGCFTMRPTRASAASGRLETCERCGRILFPLEERPQPVAATQAVARSAPKRGGRKSGGGERRRRPDPIGR